MRAGLSTIQQTLTPEAATVLNQSIAEASRRNHGQTTPLHVAATLLASPSGYLRQACIRSHPNSSHPLQCRALELCFSVALERLPTAQNTAPPAMEPPISNALMAALKRAQAHQRRGCPEQQQQPLLAVKVELDQFIISILDDPSVSRVMREASFSSPAVKATIEQSLNSSSTSHGHHLSGGNVNFGPRVLSNQVRITTPLVQIPSPVLPLANRNIYLNPRLQQRGNEVNKVLDIMARSKKRNPVLVGNSEPQAVVRELLRKIENKELGSDGIFKNAKVISMERGLLSLSDKNEIPVKIKELGGVIDGMIKSGGVILDLGDLKWLVEQAQPVVLEIGRAAVVEVAELLARFRGDENHRLWLIGTATCETYMRCQVYHSAMENDWDLKAVSMASSSPPPGFFPRLGTERLLSNPVEPLTPLCALPSPLPALTTRVFENSYHAQTNTFCPQCSENYKKELTELTAIEKLFSKSKQEATQPSLPQWLLSAKLDMMNPKIADESSQGKDQGLLPKHKAQELENKWRDTCLHLHPTFHQSSRADTPSPPTLSMTSLYDLNPLRHPIFQHNLQPNKPRGEALQLNANQFITNQHARLANNSLPGSPVRTDLVLGRNGTENQSKDLFGCISSEKQNKLVDKFADGLNADTYKKLLRGLMEKAWWQGEAASAVASAITRCRLGNGQSRGGGSRGDIWLLFAGPDRVGKKKIALVLAEQICGSSPIMIRLGRKDDPESDVTWGKTAIDRITEAVRRNPFSVIMLEDIDEAEMHVREIKQAIERGKLTDSHGREVSLGNAIFILTGDWSSSNNLEASRDSHFINEKRLASIASGNWELGLVVREKSNKRRPSWLEDEDRSTKTRKELEPCLSLDLNLAAFDTEDDKTDGSDVTVDHDLVNQRHFSVTSVPHDLLDNVDDAIVFKPVDSAFVRREIKKTISSKFSMMVDNDKLAIEVEDDVLEKILGGLWHDRMSLGDWIEKALAPSFARLKQRLLSDDGRSSLVVRLVVEFDSGSRDKSNGGGDWLPSSILV